MIVCLELGPKILESVSYTLFLINLQFQGCADLPTITRRWTEYRINVEFIHHINDLINYRASLAL